MMFLIKFTFRRIIRQLGLNIMILFGLSLAAGFVAALPGYAVAVSADTLESALNSASAPMRNIQLIGPSTKLSAALKGDIKDQLKVFYQETYDVINLELGIKPIDQNQIETPGVLNVESLYQIEQIAMWNFTPFYNQVELLSGRKPERIVPLTLTEQLQPPKFEVLIGAETSLQTGLNVGDVLETNFGSKVTIVGIVKALDPEDEAWWGKSSYPFDIVVIPKNSNEDSITIPMFGVQQAIIENFPEFDRSWRIILDQEKINVNSIADIKINLDQLKTYLQTKDMNPASGLDIIINNFQEQVSIANQTMLLLSIQAFIFALYLISMLSSFMLERSQLELSALVSRGASKWQLILIFALQGGILAIPAGLIFGPVFARAGLQFWGMVTGSVIPTELPPSSLILSLGASFFGWLAIVIPVVGLSMKNLAGGKTHRTRPDTRSFIQKNYIDLLLFVIGALIIWQLSRTGTYTVSSEDGNVVDPIMMIGPTIFLISVGLLFLRIFPVLLRLSIFLSKWIRGLPVFMGLTRLSRSPVGPSKVILLISVAAGLTFFANVFDDSLVNQQEDIAEYLIGSKLRISTAYDSEIDYEEMEGVNIAMQAFRSRLMVDGPGSAVTLLAVDSSKLAELTAYPAGVSTNDLSTIAAVLSTDGTEPIPAIFSTKNLTRQTQFGDQTTVSLFGKLFDVTINGAIVNFPTLEGKFIIVDYHALNSLIDLWDNRLGRSHEVWVDADSEFVENFNADEANAHLILGNSYSQLEAMQADALSKGAKGAFVLNAFILIVLSIVGLILVSYFSAKQRMFEFSILRSLGLSTRQLVSMLFGEGILIMALGLGAGTGIGYALSYVMKPFMDRTLNVALAGASTFLSWIDYLYLSQAKPVSLMNVSMGNLIFNWAEISTLYGFLIVFYIIALMILMIILIRGGIHRVLRIGEE